MNPPAVGLLFADFNGVNYEAGKVGGYKARKLGGCAVGKMGYRMGQSAWRIAKLKSWKVRGT